MEIAITGYQIALTVFSVEAFPLEWADIQNHLAVAYSERTKGDKVENLEMAIATYRKGLQVTTFPDFP